MSLHPPKTPLTDAERAAIDQYLKRNKVKVIPRGASAYDNPDAIVDRSVVRTMIRKRVAVAQARKDLLVDYVKLSPQPTMAALALRFKVSESTIHADLRALRDNGRLKPEHLVMYLQRATHYRPRKPK